MRTKEAMAEIGRRKLDLDCVHKIMATLSPKQTALFCELSPNQILLMRELLAMRAPHVGAHVLKRNTSIAAGPTKTRQKMVAFYHLGR